MTALIAFNGQGQMGSMALAFDHRSIDAMASKVFAQPGVKLDAVGIADLAGELANQVLGKTKANFMKLGLQMQMGACRRSSSASIISCITKCIVR